MSASSRLPTSRFHPGIAAMYVCTGASPSPFAICGFPPERSLTFFRAGAALFVLVFAAVFLERADLVRDFCEDDAAIIERAKLSFRIFYEADHFTIAAGQHHDANSVRLG